MVDINFSSKKDLEIFLKKKNLIKYLSFVEKNHF